ncbi:MULTISPECIES: helix-turn-helix domain-containing protein [Streptomyces]|uniref:helix-turn-helix domain-containing protein n=1 Tax=Streptomyces TaxID=1883 RepID=UPI00068A5F3C|nr:MULTISPECIES: helix-turn-helix transcriptional regulator [Streptomyces]
MTRSSAGAAERPFAHLAEHLTALRRAARLPQRTLAQAANISRGTVQRAESGAAAPTPAVLDAYVRACSGTQDDHDRARLLRIRGRTVQRDRLRHLDAPAPSLIHTEDDLGVALAAAYERAGAPPLSDARLTPGRRPLPRTTAWRIVKRKELPSTPEQLVTFLTACGIEPAKQRPYVEAFHRITNSRSSRPVPPPPRRHNRYARQGVPLHADGTDGPPDYVGRISPAFQVMLSALSPDEITAVLNAGISHLLEERARLNGKALDWFAPRRLVKHHPGNRENDGAKGHQEAKAEPWVTSPPLEYSQDHDIDWMMRKADGTAMLVEVERGRPDPPSPQTPLGTKPPLPTRPVPARTIRWASAPSPA